MPFTGCGGATSLSTDDGSELGGAGAGGKTSTGGRPQAGQGGRAEAGTASVGGSAGGAGGMVNVAGSAGAVTGGSAGEGGGSFLNPFPCRKPIPFPIPGTGYELCSDSFIHRTGQAACPPGGECSVDAQCGSGRACVCQGNGYGSCQKALCTSDADCLSGFLCIAGAATPTCGGEMGLACQQPTDACAGSQGCDTCSGCIPGIGPGVVAGRACQPCCAVGRPFLVEGLARVAGVEERRDWCAELEPSLAALSAGQRALLAKYWRDNGLMEHASVAAFARFVLDLLSLGAPAELVDEATRAMSDEASHTKACFALASAYASSAIGPSALAVAGSLDQRDLREIVMTTVLEGCVGETVAAMEAAEALAHAGDHAVRSALTRIAADELRHAALAYRFVAWARSRYGSVVDGYVTDAFAVAFTSTPAAEATTEADAVPAHGLLSAQHRAELRALVLAELVAPSIPSLLAA
jgi:hypothetical protein